jgi:hypothetical protein
MSIAATTAATVVLRRRSPVEFARRLEIAESLAASIYPWPALEFEIRALDRIGWFLPSTKAATAGFWMRMQLLGDAVAEKSGFLFPGMDWDLDEAETCALASVTPFTIDETIIGRIVAFSEATRRLCVPDDSIEDRSIFRAAVIDLAKEPRLELIETADRARQRKKNLRLVDAAPGWFRIEYPRNVAEIHRALKDEGEENRSRRIRRRAA